MPINSPMELFLEELAGMYDAEHRLIPILQGLAGEAQNSQNKQAYEQHLHETEHQIQNLAQVFQILGQQPRRQACLAIEGIKQEHDTFKKQNPTPHILEAFDLGGAEKTEHYEIGSYLMLIQQCQLMNQPECVRLLQQNLQQEQAMAERVLHFGDVVGRQLIAQASQMYGQGQAVPGATPPA